MWFLWTVLGCGGGGEQPQTSFSSTSDSALPTSETTHTENFEGYPCAEGLHCADEGPFLEYTCCALGDALRREASAAPASAFTDDTRPFYVEYAKAKVLDDLLLVSNLYGLEVWNLPDLDLLYSSSSEIRFTDMAIGPKDERGQVLHTVFKGVSMFPDTHPDADWSAEMKTSVVSNTGQVAVDVTFDMSGRVFTSIARVGDYLYVSEPAVGVVVMESATLTEVHVEPLPEVHFVREGLGGLVALTSTEVVRLDLADPSRPSLDGAVRASLSHTPVDLWVDESEVWVALGGAGIAIYDDQLEMETVPGLDKGAWAITRQGRDVVVSAWEALWVLDAETRQVVDRETHALGVGPSLGLDWSGDTLVEAGWSQVRRYRYHPGYIAPQLRHGALKGVGDDVWSISVHNEGPLEWVSEEVSVSAPEILTELSENVLPPGGVADLTVEGALPDDGVTIELTGNDPDGPFLISIDENPLLLSLGDQVDRKFAPLTASGSLDEYNGRVTLLAYFALY